MSYLLKVLTVYFVLGIVVSLVVSLLFQAMIWLYPELPEMGEKIMDRLFHECPCVQEEHEEDL